MIQEKQMTDKKTILIVDDDHDIGDVLQRVIASETDYRTIWIAESDLVLVAAERLHPSLILLDYMMPTLNGLQLYDRLQEAENMRGVPVVLISAATHLPFDELHRRGIILLKKPFEVNDLLDILADQLK